MNAAYSLLFIFLALLLLLHLYSSAGACYGK